MTRFSLVRALCLLLLTIPACAFAKGDPELTQFGHDIRVEAGQKVGEVTCFNCSIYIAGESSGELTTLHGNIIVESGGSIAGDVTAIWGDVRMQPGTQIAGEVTALAGGVRRSPQSSIAGDVTSFEGTKWVLLIIVPPLLVLGFVVALIVWLVQRRRPAQLPQPTFATQRQATQQR
jgi:hypothetical protein